jgi:hypothetical protein
MAYAVLGLAMNYYLTRDPMILADIESLREHIFETYWDAEIGMMRWTPPNIENEQELVAQLEQLSSYLVLLYRLIPANLQVDWQADITTLTEVLIDDFYSQEHNLFWGGLTPPTRQAIGSFQTDFGHTIKAMRMIYLVGRLFEYSRRRY